ELPLTLNLLLNPVFVPELALIGGNVIEPMPVPRGRLGKTPIWERLSKAGRRTAVIRLPFTHPADGQADYVISNRTVTDLWDVLSVETATAGLVEPSSKSGELLAWFSKRRRIDPALGSTLFGRPGWPKPGDAIVNPEEVLMRVVDTSERMIGVTRAIVAGDPD